MAFLCRAAKNSLRGTGSLFRLSGIRYDMYTGENRPMTVKEISNRNSDAAFGTIFRISNRFKEASRNLIIIFIRPANLKPSVHEQKIVI